MPNRPDAIFAVPRLAEIYDLLEGKRDDLEPYLAMAAGFGARSALDVGCGTGTFACLLAERQARRAPELTGSRLRVPRSVRPKMPLTWPKPA